MYAPSLPLTMLGAELALAEGLRAIETGETGFDLAAAQAVDSVAVAILLAWQRAAKVRGASLDFCNPPPVLRSLAVLYGVDELLHFTRETDLQRH